MRNFQSSSFVVLALLMTASLAARADTLNGAGSWQSWSPSILGTSGVPFWNNASGEGPNYNIGWCLAGGGNCSISNPPGALPYFGNGTADVNNMWFSSGGSGVTLSLRGVFTSQDSVASGIDYIGYYTLDPSGMVMSTKQLFAASDSLGSTAFFTISPNTNYGFYLENVLGQGQSTETDTWLFMDSSQNYDNRGNPLTPLQHIAVFQNGASGYYLAFEDCISQPCDLDYNDMIVQMSASPTPEPASTALAGLGLLGFGLLLGRYKLNRDR